MLHVSCSILHPAYSISSNQLTNQLHTLDSIDSISIDITHILSNQLRQTPNSQLLGLYLLALSSSRLTCSLKNQFLVFRYTCTKMQARSTSTPASYDAQNSYSIIIDNLRPLKCQTPIFSHSRALQTIRQVISLRCLGWKTLLTSPSSKPTSDSWIKKGITLFWKSCWVNSWRVSWMVSRTRLTILLSLKKGVRQISLASTPYLTMMGPTSWGKALKRQQQAQTAFRISSLTSSFSFCMIIFSRGCFSFRKEECLPAICTTLKIMCTRWLRQSKVGLSNRLNSPGRASPNWWMLSRSLSQPGKSLMVFPIRKKMFSRERMSASASSPDICLVRASEGQLEVRQYRLQRMRVEQHCSSLLMYSGLRYLWKCGSQSALRMISMPGSVCTSCAMRLSCCTDMKAGSISRTASLSSSRSMPGPS